MTAIIFALISCIGWAVGDIFGVAATRKIGAFPTTFWVFLFGSVIFTFYTSFALADLAGMTAGIFLLIVLLSFFYIGGNLAINEAFRVSNPSLTGTIGASFAGLTALFSVIFLGETISLSQTVSILIIFIGLVLSSLDFDQLRKGSLLKDRGVRLAFLAMFSWAVYFTFIKIPIRTVGWFWPTYLSFLTFPLLLFFMRKKKMKLYLPV